MGVRSEPGHRTHLTSLRERLGESGATHDSQSASRSGVEAWVARILNGWDDSDAGVPAKMRTRENVHLTILRQRILIRRQNSPVKCSRENGSEGLALYFFSFFFGRQTLVVLFWLFII